MDGTDLKQNPIHLGQGATAVVQPPFTGDMAWYGGYQERHAGDGIDGRLVSLHQFSRSWDMWEVHPEGSEVVICVSGEMEIVQEQPDGSELIVSLSPGQFAINPPGVWHTANVAGEASAVFVTAGVGTRHRPR